MTGSWTRLILALALALPPAAAAARDEPEEEMATVARAAWAEDRLWLLTDEGKLATVAPEAAGAIPVAVPERALDLCRHEGRALIATSDGESRPVWTLRRRHGGRWTALVAVAAERDTLVGIECREAEVTVLTSRRLIAWDGRRARILRLSEPLHPGYVTTNLHTLGDTLFVGLNNGEWGGGLRRVHRRTGRVTLIEHIRPWACGGRLNPRCDPVNGIADLPWKPGCVAAAIGLVHFVPGGRIVEVCDDRVERLFFKPYDSGWPERGELDDGEPWSTVAFFGLVRRGGSLWAAGIDGLYELRGEGEPEFRPMPEFRNVGGFWLSDDLPGFVLVATDIARRASVSASSPLLVERDDAP